MKNAMEIEAVQPTARENRPFRRGWGPVHWVYLLPTSAYLFGFSFFGLGASMLLGDLFPTGLFIGSLAGSWVLNKLGGHLFRKVWAQAAQKSPTGGLAWRWRIDDQALSFDNGLQANRVDWRAVKSVREESDRFLFLVSPAYNPVPPIRLLDGEQLQVLRDLVTDLRQRGVLGAGVD